jgi:hypothetical protein
MVATKNAINARVIVRLSEARFMHTSEDECRPGQDQSGDRIQQRVLVAGRSKPVYCEVDAMIELCHVTHKTA